VDGAPTDLAHLPVDLLRRYAAEEMTSWKRTLGSGMLSIPGRCFTKQTGDMVYTMAENSWLSQLWLDA
jgi:hypothetical protein